MAATTMEQITLLIEKLKSKSPDVTFVAGDEFGWSPKTKTVTYSESSPEMEAYLLHEYGHALLDHDAYERDIDLIAMERDAWKTAQETASHYNLTIESGAIEGALDTYRDWMHARALCPACDATGIETSKHEYTCIACRNRWHVNEARRCALRRYTTK